MTKDKRPYFTRLFDTDRRQFLKTCGILAGGVVAGGTLQALLDVARVGSEGQRLSVTRTAMGTLVTVHAIDPSRKRAERAIGKAFAEMNRLTALLSRHQSDTPLALLNRDGRLNDAPPELVTLIEASRRFHRHSQGAFDITVKPLVELLKGRPDEQEIKRVLPLVDAGAIALEGRRIWLKKAGMGLTLDGIAKGFIVDRMVETLQSNGIENLLVDAGGDIRTVGHRAPGKPWRIAIQDPKKQGRHPAIIEMSTGALATSGSYEIYYDQQRLFHHLVDPRSGHSPQHIVSSTVRTSTVLAADALSTSAFVLKPGLALGLLSRLSTVEGVLIDQAGKLRSTPGWV